MTTHAGEWLERRVEPDPLVRAHTQLGDTLLPWAIGVFVVATAVWALDRLTARVSTGGPQTSAPGDPTTGAAPARPSWTRPPARIVLAALALVVSVGSVVQVYRIGESGSRAAWHDAYQQTPTGD